MDIQYRFFENPQCEARAKEIISGFQWLLPPWLHELHVDSASQPEDDSSVAHALIKPEYGLATIAIYPLFWESTPHNQHLFLLHEVIHVAHGRVLSLVQRRLLSHLKEANPDLHMFCEDEFRERTEEFVENLARSLSTLMTNLTQLPSDKNRP